MTIKDRAQCGMLFLVLVFLCFWIPLIEAVYENIRAKDLRNIVGDVRAAYTTYLHLLWDLIIAIVKGEPIER